MFLNKFQARVAEVSDLKTSYERDEQGQVLFDEMGQPVVKATWVDVTFDDGRISPELFGPFKVFGPAERFSHPVGTMGLLTLRMLRRASKEGQGYYMTVDLVDFEAGVAL